MLNGRVGLRDFWSALIALAIVWGIWPYIVAYFTYLLIYLLPKSLLWPLLSSLDYILLSKPLIFVLLTVRLFVRRLHDHGQSGWAGLLITPLLSAMFESGKMESNKFGPFLKHKSIWATLFA
jgi:uncharacterized membrane protein YhaH (DUF805 family)